MENCDILSVYKIVELARMYSAMPWKEWGTSDLAEIHVMLASLALKHPIKYTVEILQDGPTEVIEAQEMGVDNSILKEIRWKFYNAAFCLFGNARWWPQIGRFVWR